MTLLKDKFIGCLLGTAIGDSLGMVVEGLNRESIRQKYGVLRDYQDERFGKGRYTDDTQMTLCVAESIIEMGEFSPEDIGKRFIGWLDYGRGMGYACKKASERLAMGISWRESGVDSAGCGSAMRVAPIGLFRYKHPKLLKEETIKSSHITHIDTRAKAGATAVAYVISVLLKTNNNIDKITFVKDTSKFVEDIDRFFSQKLISILNYLKAPFEEGIERIGVGGYVMETVPAAFFTFIRCPHNFEEAMILAVNSGGDTDSIAAILGGISGTYHGYKKIPKRWLKDLEERDRIISVAENLYDLSKKENKR